MTRILVAATALFLASMSGGANAQQLATATFAGGCFWCVESDFDAIPGVVETVSGYIGGMSLNPTYEQVSAGGTGHLEAVQITYDPDRVAYEDLLAAFWRSVDPTDAGGQFCDRGESYQTAVFVNSDAEGRVAELSKMAAEASLGQTIVTPIVAGRSFFPAEAYHQDYYQRNPLRYRFYRWNCGRDRRVKEVWGEQAYHGIPGHG